MKGTSGIPSEIRSFDIHVTRADVKWVWEIESMGIKHINLEKAFNSNLLWYKAMAFNPVIKMYFENKGWNTEYLTRRTPRVRHGRQVTP